MNQELYEKFCHEYEKKGLWEHSTHGSKLKNCAEKYGERIALIDEQEEISYQELDLRSDQMAAWMLHEGFVKGERIVIQHVNCIGFAVMCFAMFKIGVIPVLAMPSHGMRELSGIVKTAQPKGFIVIETYHGVDHLAEAGFDAKYGARPLRRAIQSKIEDRLANELLEGRIRRGDCVQVQYRNKEIRFTVKAK